MENKQLTNEQLDEINRRDEFEENLSNLEDLERN